MWRSIIRTRIWSGEWSGWRGGGLESRNDVEVLAVAGLSPAIRQKNRRVDQEGGSQRAKCLLPGIDITKTVIIWQAKNENNFQIRFNFLFLIDSLQIDEAVFGIDCELKTALDAAVGEKRAQP